MDLYLCASQITAKCVRNQTANLIVIIEGSWVSGIGSKEVCPESIVNHLPERLVSLKGFKAIRAHNWILQGREFPSNHRWSAQVIQGKYHKHSMSTKHQDKHIFLYTLKSTYDEASPLYGSLRVSGNLKFKQHAHIISNVLEECSDHLPRMFPVTEGQQLSFGDSYRR